MSNNIIIPLQITQELRVRQQIIAKVNNEINLILKTYMATFPNDKVYKLNDDLTELIEIEVKPETSKDKESQE